MIFRLQTSLGLFAVGAACFAAYGLTRNRVKPVQPTDTLLFNGWGVTPVGDHVKVGDMPLKVVLSPDGNYLVTSSLGFSGMHLTTLDVRTHKVVQDLNAYKVWNGLAFSTEGKKLYAGGGNSGKLMEFSYNGGQLTKTREIIEANGLLCFRNCSPAFKWSYLCL